MDFKGELGLDLELLYYIRKIEDILDNDHAVSLMSEIWYGGYDYNRVIIKDKETIYEGVALYILNNKPIETEINSIIKGIKLIFGYLNKRIIMNKMTNNRLDETETIQYNLNYLRNPQIALNNLKMQKQLIS
jgi:hypothetical protein